MHSAESLLLIADIIGDASKCERSKVGALIVDVTGRLIAAGYNGPPQNYPADGPCVNWCTRREGELDPNYEDCPSLHAEINALLYSDRTLREGGTIYVSDEPCYACAKAISNSGLRRVVWSQKKLRGGLCIEIFEASLITYECIT